MTEYLTGNLRIWFAELLVSLLLMFSVGVSLTAFHSTEQDDQGVEIAMADIPQMRGDEKRQMIRMGVPEVWLEQLEVKLDDHGIEVIISRYENSWLINIPIEQHIDSSVKVIFERFGIEQDNNDELKLLLTSI